MDSLKNSPSLDSDSPKENHPLTEPTQQSVPPTESTQQSAIDESEVDHDTEISLEKTKNANQALSTIEDSGFFTQSHYSFLILTSVTEEIGTNLLELLDEKYTHVRKSFYLHKAVLTLKLPSFTNSAPHAWFFQQLLQWSFNGQLTQAEARRVRVMASPLVTAQSPGYVGDQKEPDMYITPRTTLQLVIQPWLWRFSRRESGVAGTIELWGRDATGNARMIWSNRIFPVRGPVERPIYLTREDIFDGVVEPGRQGTDCLDFDLTSLRDMITEMGLNTVGLIPAP